MGEKVIDQMGHTFTITKHPQRIVSLVPSQTELLYDLGLRHEVVGITRFCCLPKTWHKKKVKVGGTKKIRLDTVAQLQPTLIIANKEENSQEDIMALSTHYPVWVSDVISFHSALDMIDNLAYLTGKKKEGTVIIRQILSAFSKLKKFTAIQVLYLIWRKPWMGVGNNTFINTLLEHMELVNVIGDQHRYPTLSDEKLGQLSPDWVLLPSEPFPFQIQHVEELKHIYPNAVITLVDGKPFSWYGSRLIHAPAYFNSLTV